MDDGGDSRVLVVGCGGIGGVLSARLAKAGVDLTIVTTNRAVREAWISTGPRLDGEAAAPPVPPERLQENPKDTDGLFDVVFIAVQPTEVRSVAEDLVGRLSERGRVVCLPNGLCEDTLAEVLGPERVIGAVVAWGARMIRPGDYTQTSDGGFKVGALSGQADPELPRVVKLLETVGPVSETTNLRGARFTKLAINCAVSTLGTIGGTTLGELLVRAEVRELALDILTEAVLVARAEGVELEAITTLDLEWLIAETRGPARKLKSAARHAALLAMGARYRNLRSSMLAAIERGRTPAVDFLNGEITRRGKKHGVPTPVNEAARRIVWEIAAGKRAAGTMALRRVREVAELLQARA